MEVPVTAMKTHFCNRLCGEDRQFEFMVPPEAPVFQPSTDEFKDPLLYISKIRPVAEKYGICKIRPPSDWQPAFAVDVDNFRFTPRIQRLNELEAKTRIKLNFLDLLAKFWELQGSKLKIPIVDNRGLDLYSLHRIVQEEGGSESVTLKKKWTKVAQQMGLTLTKNVGSTLKSHYERIIYPYDVFEQGKSIQGDGETDSRITNVTGSNYMADDGYNDQDYKPHGIPSRQAIKPEKNQNDRRAKRYSGIRCDSNPRVESSSDEIGSKELKRLQFFGAGPKMAGYNNKRKRDEEKLKNNKSCREKKLTYDNDPLAKYICLNCSRGDSEETMLLCDGCDDSYHTFCLVPPLLEVPKGDWRCPKCVAEEVSKPAEAFGFEQAQREYSLQQFGEMADQFKSDYFRLPVHRVPACIVEKEFWRIVSSIDEDVTVEYGADLHTVDHGSGFPTKNTTVNLSQQEEYIESSWNLNNLPVLKGSVLGHINASISGMKVPWMYVGMCFATFCWHNEDHWSYSINYLHWGEAKTWYGVPGSSADLFETAMKSAAPELFESQPDLLHQLVTIMNPNVLMEAGVPVFRTDQHAGEFVVTFPRAYHAGFNQGYNFAEAVNFAPADWLKMGRECINHYSLLHRFCVFSHDELVCAMCVRVDSLDAKTAAAAYEDMVQMYESEMKMRKSVNQWGVNEAEQLCFELFPDDERQCEECKTTCFLSAVTCKCSSKKLVCLRHYSSLCCTKPEACKPEQHTLWYRYTFDELSAMKEKLRIKAEKFNDWVKTVTYVLENPSEKSLDFECLKALLTEAEENSFPDSELIQALTAVVKQVEKCIEISHQLDLNRVRTRTRLNQEAKNKLKISELTALYEQMDELPCKLKEAETVNQLLKNCKDFEKEAEDLLQEDNVDLKEMEKCIETGSMLDIELLQLPKLRVKLEQLKWLEEYNMLMEKSDQITCDNLVNLIKAASSIVSVFEIEQAITKLRSLLESIESWEEKAKLCLSNRSQQNMSHLENILNEADGINAFLPSKNAVKDNLRKAREWNAKVKSLKSKDIIPYIDLLEELVTKGQSILVHLEVLPLLEAQLSSAKLWKDRVARIFLLKNSQHSLMEAISPRSEVGAGLYKTKRRGGLNREREPTQLHCPVIAGVKLSGTIDPADVVAAFKRAEKNEMELMKNLRLQNISKRLSNTAETKYCICKRPAFRFMLECALCHDWFHGSCVSFKKGISKDKNLLSELKFLCPVCLRSRRPKLETVVALLVSLQKLSVRLPEGEALQCLTERAMSWQDRARQILSTDEMIAASAKLSVMTQPQRSMDTSFKQKNEKVAVKSDLHRVTGISSGSIVVSNSEFDAVDRKFNESMIYGSYSSCDLPVAYSNSEHAYSSVSKLNTGAKKHVRKSPLVPRVLEEPPFTLSNRGRALLMDLMAEGDLIEVSLDETNQIWQILQAAKHRSSPAEKYQDVEDLVGLASPALRSPMSSLSAPQKIGRRKSDNTDMTRSESKKLRMSKLSPVSGVNNARNERTQKYTTKGRKQKPVVKEDFGEDGNLIINKGNDSGNDETNSNDEDGTDDNETSEDDCAAELCTHPTGSEVDWVQCDGGCEQWFHLHCVGLKKSDVSEDKDYVCDRCRLSCKNDTKEIDVDTELNKTSSIDQDQSEKNNESLEYSMDVERCDSPARDEDINDVPSSSSTTQLTGDGITSSNCD